MLSSFLPPPPDDSVLHLTFYYLMNLNIMTVKAKVTTATELITPISAGYWACATKSGLREAGVTIHNLGVRLLCFSLVWL